MWNLGACMLALLVVACGGESGTVEQQEAGTVSFPLVSSTSDGKTYRLVGASFTLTGPQTVTLTDTAADTVQTSLTAGAYTAELKGTWHLERTDAPGVTVPAQLVSPNPLPFIVGKNETTEVRFLFKLAGNGTADVGIKVDAGGWISGTFHFTSSPSPSSSLSELVGKDIPFLVSYGSLRVDKDTWSSPKRMFVSSDGPITVQFGGPPSAQLARIAASLQTGGIFFTMSADGSGGRISIEGITVRSATESYRLDVLSSGPIPGAVDANGYPALRPFEFTSDVYLDDRTGPGTASGRVDVKGAF